MKYGIVLKRKVIEVSISVFSLRVHTYFFPRDKEKQQLFQLS